MGLQGETTPTIVAAEMDTLREWIGASGMPHESAQDRVKAVTAAIKATGLPKRHMRHAVAIAASVYGKNSSLVDLSGDLMSKFSRFFRFLEHAWTHSKTRGSRVYFLNYKFLIRTMCYKWDVDHSQLGGLKSQKLTKTQEILYAKLWRVAQGLKQVRRNNVTFEF